MPPSAHAAGETTEAATSQATEAPSAASGPIAVTPRFRINRANEPGFVRPAEKFIAPQAPVLNLLAFGQVLGSLTDYNLASADEDDLSVLRSIAPSHHRYIVEIDPNGCALRSVHFTHDAIAAPLPYWIYPALVQIV